MQENQNRRWLPYVITFAACAVLTFLYILSFGAFRAEDPKEVAKIIVNGFFAVGIICAGVGAFIIIADNGFFDIFVYGMARFFSLFKKDVNDVKYKTFYDYKVAKAERKEKGSFGFMVYIGLLFVAVSLILLFTIYY